MARTVCAQFAFELQLEAAPAAHAKYDLKCSRIRCCSPWAATLPMRTEKSLTAALAIGPGESKHQVPLNFSIVEPAQTVDRVFAHTVPVLGKLWRPAAGAATHGGIRRANRGSRLPSQSIGIASFDCHLPSDVAQS